MVPEGGGGVERVHNKENHLYICLYWGKKISRTSSPIPIQLCTNHPLIKEIQYCTNKGLGPLQRGDNNKNAKMGWGH
jgi:hypothetical protein